MKTLLVVLLLLVFGAGAASAESAWVLWSDEPQPRGTRPQWSILSTHQGQKECESALAKELEWYSRLASFQVNYEDKAVFVALMGGGRLQWVRFVCIPDSVDPRGPKGAR